MATEKMFKAVISGPVEKVDDAIKTIALSGSFHMLPAAEALQGYGKLSPLPDDNEFSAPLQSLMALMGLMGLEPDFRDFEGKCFTPEGIAMLTNKLTERFNDMSAEAAEATRAAERCEKLALRLAPYALLGVELEQLLAVRWLDMRFGACSKSSYRAIREEADDSSDVFLFRTGEDEDEVFCVYLALPDKAEEVARRFSSLGYDFVATPAGDDLAGIPGERIQALEQERREALARAEELREKLALLAKSMEKDLQESGSYLTYHSQAAALRVKVASHGGEFFMTGWLPRGCADEIRAAADALSLKLDFAKPSFSDYGHVPVKLRDGFIHRIFSPFVEMYGYPSYGELDPRIFMTLSYSLLFGIMFGDIGQGAVLAIFGLLLYKLKGSWLGRILTCVGCSSVVFGFIYGSIFGNEHLLPGFKVLEGGNLMTMLIAAVAVGAVLIAVCGVLNIVTGFRQHDVKKAVFSANGIIGLILYLGVLAGIAGPMILDIDLFGNKLYLVFALILPFICLFCAEPLSELCAGEKHWLPKSVGMFFISGFFDLFEAALSWFANTVSFLRVGAYAICHAGMMTVVYTLSTTSSGKVAIWGVVVGNLIVMVIEALLVCIQSLRLEFYELFGRFYSGRGQPFRPERIDYSGS